MFTIGVWARRALCRLAMPFPKPGPMCRSVAAGRSVIRPYPSAAPVTTPFEEGQDWPHVGDGVEGRHEVHLRGAGVGEAHINSRIDQGADKRLCPGHGGAWCCRTGHHPGRCPIAGRSGHLASTLRHLPVDFREWAHG